jgi:hypothetical protein
MEAMAQSFPEHLKGNEAFFAALTEQTDRLLRSSFEVPFRFHFFLSFFCLVLCMLNCALEQHAWTELALTGTFAQFVQRANELEEVELAAQRRREEGEEEPACSWA